MADWHDVALDGFRIRLSPSYRKRSGRIVYIATIEGSRGSLDYDVLSISGFGRAYDERPRFSATGIIDPDPDDASWAFSDASRK